MALYGWVGNMTLGMSIRFAVGFACLAAITAAQSQPVFGPPPEEAGPPPGYAPQVGVVADELVVEPATLIALGFEWYVLGDDNGDATVEVSYREKGSESWNPALPLLRINRVERSGVFRYGPTTPWIERPNLFAGSVFDLEPDTEYEVRFLLSDPDGASGLVERVVSAYTRAEPRPAEGGSVFHVYPPDWEGPVEQPAFVGLMAAYLDGPIVTADHYNVYDPRVEAGDTILVHAGVYKDNWHYYSQGTFGPLPETGVPGGATCCGATFYGTHFLTADGTAEKPIVIKAAGDGEVIFDGDGNEKLFNLMGGDYHYFEGITFRNTKTAIEAGRKDIAGSEGLTVKNSRFENVGIGIHTDWSESKNFYIADNVFIGRNNPQTLAPWNPSRTPGGRFSGVHTERFAALRVPPEVSEMKSEYAVKLYGSGHVVAYNRVENFHDGLTHATYGVAEGWPDVPRDQLPAANDWYNNVVSNAHDDCIEVDGMLYNSRVLRNLCVNMAGTAFSTQGPGLFGPHYFLRNIVYHLPGNFAAFKNTGAPGLLVYNNTIVSAVRMNGASDASDFRNNLILAQFPEEPALLTGIVNGFPIRDYNGYLAGSDAPAPFVHVQPASGGGGPGASGVQTLFQSLQELSAQTGNDGHSRMVNFDVFRNLQPADPVQVSRVYDPSSLDFQLRRGGEAVNAGVAIPNVTDGFRGSAPDLGALEVGAPAPRYGPRN